MTDREEVYMPYQTTDKNGNTVTKYKKYNYKPKGCGSGRTKTVFSEEIKQKVASEYRNGKKIYKIEEEIGISKYHISRILRETGVVPATGKQTWTDPAMNS